MLKNEADIFFNSNTIFFEAFNIHTLNLDYVRSDIFYIKFGKCNLKIHKHMNMQKTDNCISIYMEINLTSSWTLLYCWLKSQFRFQESFNAWHTIRKKIFYYIKLPLFNIVVIIEKKSHACSLNEIIFLCNLLILKFNCSKRKPN